MQLQEVTVTIKPVSLNRNPASLNSLTALV